MNTFKGTLAATQTSDELQWSALALVLDFPGTGSVDLEWFIGDEWVTIDTYTENVVTRVFAHNLPIRLNCSAASAAVNYTLQRLPAMDL